MLEGKVGEVEVYALEQQIVREQQVFVACIDNRSIISSPLDGTALFGLERCANPVDQFEFAE